MSELLEGDSPYNDLPPRDELWDIVREAAIYLDTLLLELPEQSTVKFNALTWGRGTPDQCEVCLAGLWYLCQYGELIPSLDTSSEYESLPEPMYSIVNFIDALRWADMEADTIYKYLGVEVPHNLRYTLHSEYDSTNPYHIQLFLEWLLEHI